MEDDYTTNSHCITYTYTLHTYTRLDIAIRYFNRHFFSLRDKSEIYVVKQWIRSNELKLINVEGKEEQNLLRKVEKERKTKASSTRASFHPEKVSMTGFICSCGRRNMPSFSLTSFLVEKLACQLFNKQICQGKRAIFPVHTSKKNWQGENLFLWTTLEACDLRVGEITQASWYWNMASSVWRGNGNTRTLSKNTELKLH